MHNTPSAAATPSTVHRASGMCLCKIWSLLCQWQRACLPGLSLCSAASRIYTVHHEARLLLETRMLPLQRRIPLVCKCWW